MNPSQLTNRPVATWAASLLVLVLAIFPEQLFAQAPKPTPTTVEGVPLLAQAPQPGTAKVQGEVTDENSVPLVDTLVRVAVPAVDMRDVYPGSGHTMFEGRTDKQGRYSIEVKLPGPASCSVDALKPGFRTGAGSFMFGGDKRNGSIKPGDVFEASFVLPPSLYLAGTLVDDDGQPLPDVMISAIIDTHQFDGDISRTVSGKDGKFEVFNFPLSAPEESRGLLIFQRAPLADARIKDVYALVEQDRGKLKIAMHPWRKLSCRVVDHQGNAVKGALVSAMCDDDDQSRKGAITDSNGIFSLVGLPHSNATVQVLAAAIKQNFEQKLLLDRDRTDLKVELLPMVLKEPLDSIELFGLKLATLTPELRKAYLVPDEARGVVVLDPGPDSSRLGIGELLEGDYFVRVGEYGRPWTIREFVQRALRLANDPNDPETHVVPLVTEVRRAKSAGRRTEYLRLTAAQMQELQRASVELAKREPPTSLDERGPRHAFLGVAISDLATASIGDQKITGLRLVHAVAGSPAVRAGLSQGDLLMSIDGVAIQDGRQLHTLIRSHKPGDKVTIKFVSDTTNQMQSGTAELDDAD